MINQPMPPFLNVVPNQTATLRVPRYALNLQKLVLELGGQNFTKAHILSVKIKLGVRLVYELKGSEIDTINKYKGIQDEAGFLTLDFTERDASGKPLAKEVGGFDLASLGDMTVEVAIGAATAPELTAFGLFTPMQGNNLVTKMVAFPASTSVAGRFVVPFDPRGAMVKRVHFFFASGNETANRIEFKKNGTTLHDLTRAQNFFMQREFRKVPQEGHIVLDWIHDNNMDSMLRTDDARLLELSLWLDDPDSMNVVMELIDVPGNA